MSANELRKDYMLNRWVFIAKDRKKRPKDFIQTSKTVPNNGTCPLCPNNEHITPSAVLVYISTEEKIKKVHDTEDFIHRNWSLRVIPNMYPVVDSSPKDEPPQESFEYAIAAVGYHEVIVESPCHKEEPSIARISQLVQVVNAYVDRIKSLSQKPYVKHVAIFKNYGPKSGASLLHPHSQLITTPFIPSIVQQEFAVSKSYWNKNKECLLCNVLKMEIKGPRFIWQNKSFAVFSPWASINSFEFWVLPKRHQSNIAEISNDQINDLAETLRVCFGGLRSLLNDPSYNFGIHSLLSEGAKDCYHWHLEVYPRLATWGGLEKSTGVFINAISPEDAAKELKTACAAEKQSLV